MMSNQTLKGLKLILYFLHDRIYAENNPIYANTFITSKKSLIILTLITMNKGPKIIGSPFVMLI